MTLLARNYFNDALPAAAPIGPPDSYVVTMESARDIPGASHIDSTGEHDVLVLRNGERLALNVLLCCGCDTPLIENHCTECGE